MRNDAIESALIANDASLLKELTGAERTQAEPIEPEASSGLSAFPEIAYRGAFADYKDAMEGTTEASNVAHFASLWATCAVRLGRRIYMFAGERVYPNVYLVNFGCTGDKKTTAMRRPKNTGLLADVRVISNLGSTEGLADRLQSATGDAAVAMFLWEELAALFARGRWSGSTILEFLTECFDCPAEWGLSYRKNPIAITAPTPTALAGTTPEWFWKNARADDFFGGFGNRFLYLTGPKKAPLPNPKQPNESKLALVSAALEVLGHLSGEARFSTAAEKLWDHFYRDFEAQDRKGLFAAATKRIHVYIRKLAMLYAALEGTFPEISLEQLKAAIAVGVYGAECARLLIDSQVSVRPEAELEQRFVDWVRNHPGSKKRTMQQTLSKYSGTCEVFNRIFTNLVRAGVIEVRTNCVYLAG